MRLLKNIYRRFDLLQHALWFRIAASVLVLALCGGFFGYMLARSHGLETQRNALTAALINQNIERGDEHAVSLRNTGTVHVNGRTYGGEALRDPRTPLFDSAGNILGAPVLAEYLLNDQRPAWAPDWLLDEPATTWMLALVTTAWLLAIVWMSITLPFLLTLLGTAIPVTIFGLAGSQGAMLACAGIGLLTFTFVLLSRVLLLALNRPWQVFAVAHTVVKEASRTRLSLVFIILLLIVLPLLPLTLDDASPLRFRVQTFISRSMNLAFVLAALLTLFLSCASVAFEIRDRQIWQLVTKPMHRLNYLLGKWLGVLAVNLVILAVSGVSIFTFIQYLKNQPPLPGEAGVYDSLAVTDEILTARVGVRPTYDRLKPEEVRARMEELIRTDPTLAEQERIPPAVRRKYEEEMQQAYTFAQRSVPPTVGPNPTDLGRREYVFEGIRLKDRESTLTLRYKFHILRDDEHQKFRAVFVFNDDLGSRRIVDYVPTMWHSFPIGPDLVRTDGAVKVTIINLSNVGSLNFDETDFEILYKVAHFEGNFIRAVLMSWMKLAFLAAMGVCAATFLSFPVACLLSFTVFIGGAISPFLAEALEWYYPPEQVDWSNVGMVIYWAVHVITRAIAQVVVFLLSAFGEYRPNSDLVTGKFIPWSAVLMGFARIGVLWTGLSMLIGWLVMRKRQLAIYSGQG